MHDEVRGACEMLGLDPLYVANEGKLVAIVPADVADSVLRAMRAILAEKTRRSSGASPARFPAWSP